MTIHDAAHNPSREELIAILGCVQRGETAHMDYDLCQSLAALLAQSTPPREPTEARDSNCYACGRSPRLTDERWESIGIGNTWSEYRCKVCGEIYIAQMEDLGPMRCKCNNYGRAAAPDSAAPSREDAATREPERCVTNLSQEQYDALVRDAMQWRAMFIASDPPKGAATREHIGRDGIDADSSPGERRELALRTVPNCCGNYRNNGSCCGNYRDDPPKGAAGEAAEPLCPRHRIVLPCPFNYCPYSAAAQRDARVQPEPRDAFDAGPEFNRDR